MTFRPKLLWCFVASAATLFGVSTSIAANRPAPSARSVGSAQLEMQVLLDRANFSSGEIDGKGGKNSREALAAFQAAHGFASGARSRNALLRALGAGTVKPIVSYTITAEDVAGPFNKTIPEDATEQSKLPGLYYTSVLEELAGKFHSAQALLKRLNPRARPQTLLGPRGCSSHPSRRSPPTRSWLDREGSAYRVLRARLTELLEPSGWQRLRWTRQEESPRLQRNTTGS